MVPLTVWGRHFQTVYCQPTGKQAFFLKGEENKQENSAIHWTFNLNENRRKRSIRLAVRDSLLSQTLKNPDWRKNIRPIDGLCTRSMVPLTDRHSRLTQVG